MARRKMTEIREFMKTRGFSLQPKAFTKREGRVCLRCDQPAGHPAYCKQFEDGHFAYYCFECADSIYHGDEALDIAPLPKSERLTEICIQCGEEFFLDESDDTTPADADLCEGCRDEKLMDVEDSEV